MLTHNKRGLVHQFTPQLNSFDKNHGAPSPSAAGTASSMGASSAAAVSTGASSASGTAATRDFKLAKFAKGVASNSANAFSEAASRAVVSLRFGWKSSTACFAALSAL